MGEAACPEDYTNVTDSISCNYAAQMLGLNYRGSKDASDPNTVCFLCPQCSPQGVYLSKGPGAAATWICQKEKKGN